MGHTDEHGLKFKKRLLTLRIVKISGRTNICSAVLEDLNGVSMSRVTKNFIVCCETVPLSGKIGMSTD